MKKFIVFFLIGILSLPANAQKVVKNNYTIGSENSITNSEKIKSGVVSANISYYDYDGYENWAYSMYILKPDGFGFEWTMRKNFDDGGNFNVDLGVNYSFSLVEKKDIQLLFTLGLAPSLRAQYEFDFEKYDWKDEMSFFFDGCANLRLHFRYKWILLSGGYNLWAPKFKFGNDYRLDGFNVALGWAF